MPWSRPRTLLLAAAVGLLPTSAGAVSFETIALSGDAAAGTGTGVTYAGFDQLQVNSSGQVAFYASLAGATEETDAGIWRGGAITPVSLVAREGGQAPSAAPGVGFGLRRLFFIPAEATIQGEMYINDAGDVVFASNLVDASGSLDPTNDAGIYGSAAGGSLAEIARLGEQAAGGPPGSVYQRLSPFTAHSNAGVGIEGAADLRFPFDAALWAPDGAGGLRLLAQARDQALGFPAGQEYSGFDEIAINNAGDAIHRAQIRIPGSNEMPDALYFTPVGGDTTLLFKDGDVLPGVPGDETFLGATGLAINDAGEVAFQAFYPTPPVDPVAGHVVYGPDGAGGLQVLALRGAQAPGAPAGALFSNASSPILLNEAGGVAFLGFLFAGAGVDASNNLGVWVPDGDGVALVAREADPVPGLLDVSFQDFDGLALNDHGEAAFEATLSGDGTDPSTDAAFFFVSASGVVRMILREGDTIEVAPGDVRVVSSLVDALNPAFLLDGEPVPVPPPPQLVGLTNDGRIAIAVAFTDGSEGVFLAQVPEPEVAALLGSVFAWASSRMMRRKPSP